MIPILYEPTEETFTSNGIGRLTDCISCAVYEERNGQYNLIMKYPITGVRFSELKRLRLIGATHDENGDVQPFEIYRRTAPINGVCTFYARHISYQLSNTILKPIEAESISSAFLKMQTETITPQTFTFWTDKTTIANFKTTVPMSCRQALGGVEGSILDVYGGEFEFDKRTVKLHNNRGADNGVSIRYGKNLTKFEQDIDESETYNTVVPFWKSMDEDENSVVVYGNPITAEGGVFHVLPWTDENYNEITDENEEPIEFGYYQTNVVTMDLSDEFDEQPTIEQLEARAESIMNANKPWNPNENIEIDFVALWQTEEYKDVAPLEHVKLCDTITVEYPDLDVSVKAKVIKTTWNVLLEKYDKIEIGNPRFTLNDAIVSTTQEATKDFPTTSIMMSAIDQATKLITGVMGGHIVFKTDSNGRPSEMYIMDSDDINTAVNVWRFNVNGWGHSRNGINGTYRLAATIEDGIVADFITTGMLTANLIKTGILSSHDGKSFWDLDGSQFKFFDSQFDSSVTLNEGYIKFAFADIPFGWLIRRGSGEYSYFCIEDGTRRQIITLSKDDIKLFADYLYMRAYDRMRVTVKNYMNIISESGNSKIDMIDNGDFQYIDANSGGDTWVRIDGKGRYIRINCDDFLINGYYGYTGTVAVGNNKTLTIENGIITNVS